MQNITISLLILVLLAPYANAEPIRQPSGLNPGDEYRLFFTTSQRRDATSSDIEDYNSFVQSLADAAPVTGTWGLEWRALAWTQETHGQDNTMMFFTEDDPGPPIYMLNGSIWVPSHAHVFGLEAGIFFHPYLGVNEFGEFIVDFDIVDDEEQLLVWTGTRPRGGSPGSALGNPFAVHGNGFGGISLPFSAGSEDTRIPGRFYAVSEALVAVPEPSGGMLYSAFLFVFLLLRNARRTTYSF